LTQFLIGATVKRVRTLKQNRRQFLIQNIGLIVTTPWVLALSRCDKSTSTLGKKDQAFSVANQPSNSYGFDMTTFPALATPGGFIQFGVHATSGYKTVSIVRFDASTLFTVLMVCPYSNCQLMMYNSTGSGGYSCPCDGSIFDVDGSVRLGPSTVPLTTYTTSVVGNLVVVVIP